MEEFIVMRLFLLIKLLFLLIKFEKYWFFLVGFLIVLLVYFFFSCEIFLKVCLLFLLFLLMIGFWLGLNEVIALLILIKVIWRLLINCCGIKVVWFGVWFGVVVWLMVLLVIVFFYYI